MQKADKIELSNQQASEIYYNADAAANAALIKACGVKPYALGFLNKAKRAKYAACVVDFNNKQTGNTTVATTPAATTPDPSNPVQDKLKYYENEISQLSTADFVKAQTDLVKTKAAIDAAKATGVSDADLEAAQHIDDTLLSVLRLPEFWINLKAEADKRAADIKAYLETQAQTTVANQLNDAAAQSHASAITAISVVTLGVLGLIYGIKKKKTKTQIAGLTLIGAALGAGTAYTINYFTAPKSSFDGGTGLKEKTCPPGYYQTSNSSGKFTCEKQPTL